jgi:hypothetical protein
MRRKPLDHRRKMMLRLGILSLGGLLGGVAALLWCRRSGATYCGGAGGMIAISVLALIGIIELYRRRP